MFIRSGKLWLYSLFVLAVVPACHQHTMKKSRLFHDTKDNVELRVEKLSERESSRQFGKDLYSCGHQPLRLTIKNNTDDMLLLRASAIGLPLESVGRVIDDAQLPVVLVTFSSAYLATLFFWPALVPVAGVGLWMGHKNSEIAGSIAERALMPQEAFEILPYEQVTKTMFVAVGMTTDLFSMHVYNADKKSFIPFRVVLS